MSGTTITVGQLAQAVHHDDELNVRTSAALLEHVLFIALKNRIAACAIHRHVDIDLGNGHVLHCTVKKIIGPIHG